MQNTNPSLRKVVFPETPLKHALVDYAGEKNKPENNEVTIEMIINTLAEDFPELILTIAEENFFRGYEQAFVDIQNMSQSSQTEE
tara:strand:- start:3077 stop:3331 length:255 start_codon:yes stop_codon:yes gene_type:complete